jgi:tetratricopeptide (TPR) repeat protein
MEMLGFGLAWAHCFRGFRCMRRGQYGAALVHLNKAQRSYPRLPAPFFCNRALAHQATGDHASAIQDCDRAIELDPNLAMAFHNRGISEKVLGDFDRAIADHSRAVELLPSFAWGHAELGVAYTCKHQHDRAIDSLTRAIALEPGNAGCWRERGFARFFRGDFEDAAADLRQSLGSEHDPYAMLMCYLARARRGAEATRELEGDAYALGTERWPYPVIDLFLGSLPPDAILSAAPNDYARGEGHFYIGQWHLLRRNRAEARQALEQVTRTCPPNFHEYVGAIAELRRLGP